MLDGLIERIERAAPGSAEREELGVAINEALGIASYITDDGDPTQSLDAAMTLLPGPDWEWSLEVQAGHLYFASEEQMVAIVKIGDPLRGWESTAATPALALCAASLRARISS